MTAKKTLANRANAQKSTGAITPDGKAVVSANGIRHGILSIKLMLSGENPAEFLELLDALQAALRPSGALELVLVEKIAAAIWRQRRLVAAESASTELVRRFENDSTRRAIENEAGLGFMGFDAAQAAGLSAEDEIQIKWCKGVQAESEALDDAVVEANDCKRLKQDAPLMFGQLTGEAKDDGASVEQYIGTRLREWAEELDAWCGKELAKYGSRPMVVAVAALVQQRVSAPVSNELLCRYQVALDNELYKAIKALREQQEWRMQSGITVEAA